MLYSFRNVYSNFTYVLKKDFHNDLLILDKTLHCFFKLIFLWKFTYFILTESYIILIQQVVIYFY